MSSWSPESSLQTIVYSDSSTVNILPSLSTPSTTPSSKHSNKFSKFWSDFRALFYKTFLLSKRKRGQTITEILLAYTFLGLLLGMRYILDRRYNHAFQLPAFRPQDLMLFNNSVNANYTYYYPSNPCTDQIVNRTITKLQTNWP
ncbi:unnamed protein product, partial [Didymodactylos carnosus]